MNKIFHYGIILFIIIGLIFNKQDEMLKAILQTPFDVFELCKTLILSICLWNGLLKIIQVSGMMNHLNFLFKPLKALLLSGSNFVCISILTFVFLLKYLLY